MDHPKDNLAHTSTNAEYRHDTSTIEDYIGTLPSNTIVVKAGELVAMPMQQKNTALGEVR